MLKFCESDQFSFLDEVAAGSQSMQLAEQVAAEVSCVQQIWTKRFLVLFFRVEYLLPIAEIPTVGAYLQEVCGSITGVVTLFGHMRCPCKQGQWTIFQ